jgi:hypothetical protein
VKALAEANDQTEAEVVKDLRKIISSRVFQNYNLSREFRTAATVLCRAVYDHDAEVQAEAADVRAWLDGTLQRITLLRRHGIFRKIGRANARQIFYSIAAWLSGSGEKGLIVTIDVARYVLGKDAPPAALQPIRSWRSWTSAKCFVNSLTQRMTYREFFSSSLPTSDSCAKKSAGYVHMTRYA